MLGSGYMPGRIGFVNVRSGRSRLALPGSTTGPHPPHSSAAATAMIPANVARLVPSIVVHRQTAPIQAQDGARRDGILRLADASGSAALALDDDLALHGGGR